MQTFERKKQKMTNYFHANGRKKKIDSYILWTKSQLYCVLCQFFGSYCRECKAHTHSIRDLTYSFRFYVIFITMTSNSNHDRIAINHTLLKKRKKRNARRRRNNNNTNRGKRNRNSNKNHITKSWQWTVNETWRGWSSSSEKKPFECVCVFFYCTKNYVMIWLMWQGFDVWNMPQSKESYDLLRKNSTLKEPSDAICKFTIQKTSSS